MSICLSVPVSHLASSITLNLYAFEIIRTTITSKGLYTKNSELTLKDNKKKKCLPVWRNIKRICAEGNLKRWEIARFGGFLGNCVSVQPHLHFPPLKPNSDIWIWHRRDYGIFKSKIYNDNKNGIFIKTRKEEREKDNDDEDAIGKKHLSKLTTGISAISLPLPERLKKLTKEKITHIHTNPIFPKTLVRKRWILLCTVCIYNVDDHSSPQLSIFLGLSKVCLISIPPNPCSLIFLIQNW